MSRRNWSHRSRVLSACAFQSLEQRILFGLINGDESRVDTPPPNCGCNQPTGPENDPNAEKCPSGTPGNPSGGSAPAGPRFDLPITGVYPPRDPNAGNPGGKQPLNCKPSTAPRGPT